MTLDQRYQFFIFETSPMFVGTLIMLPTMLLDEIFFCKHARTIPISYILFSVFEDRVEGSNSLVFFFWLVDFSFMEVYLFIKIKRKRK
jgi:hypothetical protein